MDRQTYQPRCSVVFEPGLPERFRTVDTRYYRPLDASPDLLSCTAVKTMDAPSGRFELHLTYNRTAIAAQVGQSPAATWTWNMLLLANNLVRIAFSRGRAPDDPFGEVGPGYFGAELVPWMIGLIDHVGEGALVSDEGQVVRTIRVIGRDLGKLLATHELHWQSDTLFIMSHDEAEARGAKGLNVGGPPLTMITRCMDILLDDAEFPTVKDLIIYKTGQPATDIDPITLKPVVDPRLGKADDFGFHEFTQLWDRGAFWNFLTRFNDRPFTELFTDTRPDGVFSLYFRPAPFERADWEALPGGAVPDHEIHSHQVARDDRGRINMISVQAPMLAVTQADVMFWDRLFLRWDRFTPENGSTRHGLRKMVLASAYNQPSPTAGVGAGRTLREAVADTPLYNDDHVRRLEGGDGPIVEFLRRRVEWAWRVYSQGHHFVAGRYVIKGDPFWRIGYRFENAPGSGADASSVELPEQAGGSSSFVPNEDQRRWAYVQEVAQDWSRINPGNPHYQTHLGLVRGAPLGIMIGENLPSDGRDFGRAP